MATSFGDGHTPAIHSTVTDTASRLNAMSLVDGGRATASDGAATQDKSVAHLTQRYVRRRNRQELRNRFLTHHDYTLSQRIVPHLPPRPTGRFLAQWLSQNIVRNRRRRAYEQLRDSILGRHGFGTSLAVQSADVTGGQAGENVQAAAAAAVPPANVTAEQVGRTSGLAGVVTFFPCTEIFAPESWSDVEDEDDDWS